MLVNAADLKSRDDVMNESCYTSIYRYTKDVVAYASGWLPSALQSMDNQTRSIDIPHKLSSHLLYPVAIGINCLQPPFWTRLISRTVVHALRGSGTDA
jgi:hypothetical protein